VQFIIIETLTFSHIYSSRICGVTYLTSIAAARAGYKRLNTCETFIVNDVVLAPCLHSCLVNISNINFLSVRKPCLSLFFSKYVECCWLSRREL